MSVALVSYVRYDSAFPYPSTRMTMSYTSPLSVCLLLLIVLLGTGCRYESTAPPAPAAPAPNTLTEAEKADGWRLLFDGTTTAGWRGYNRDAFPEYGWKAEDGNLIVMPPDSTGRSGGDLITIEPFDHFDLRLEFKISPEANSGILYLAQELPDQAIWHSAPEFQVLDDSAYIGLEGFDLATHKTGDNYDLHAATTPAARPVGEWNEARIVVNHGHVEHWLNGIKTVEYQLGSPEWEALVAQSKFNEYPEYGRAEKGHIGLQDHDHLVWYRNIKIKTLE